MGEERRKAKCKTVQNLPERKRDDNAEETKMAL